MTAKPQKANPSPSSIPINDPRYPIWGRLFMSRAPRIAYYGTKYLEEYGLHSSGNKNVDRELARQPQLVYLTINDLIEYYNQSQRISIVKQDDVKTIYEICQDYTFNYASQLNKSVFSHDVPFNDLIKIDEFAEAVYQHAGYEYGTEYARTFLPQGVMQNALDLNKMFDAIDAKVRNRGKKKDDQYTVHDMYSPQAARKVVIEEVKSDEDRPALPERPSMRDMFMAYMDRNGVGDRL
jgi:flagellar biosynthesis component FlhA